MKNYIILFILCALHSVAQEKLSTTSGQVFFEASIPSFEEVKATNNNAQVQFNSKSGTLNSLLYVRDFKFKNSLMFTHFNDSYMETNRYSKAIFKGKIENYNSAEVTSTFKEYHIKGRIQIKGKTKDLISVAKIRKTETGIEMKMEFNLDASDFNVKIPLIVRNKVSNKVKVINNFSLK